MRSKITFYDLTEPEDCKLDEILKRLWEIEITMMYIFNQLKKER